MITSSAFEVGSCRNGGDSNLPHETSVPGCLSWFCHNAGVSRRHRGNSIDIWPNPASDWSSYLHACFLVSRQVEDLLQHRMRSNMLSCVICEVFDLATRSRKKQIMRKLKHSFAAYDVFVVQDGWPNLASAMAMRSGVAGRPPLSSTPCLAPYIDFILSMHISRMKSKTKLRIPETVDEGDSLDEYQMTELRDFIVLQLALQERIPFFYRCAQGIMIIKQRVQEKFGATMVDHAIRIVSRLLDDEGADGFGDDADCFAPWYHLDCCK